MNPDERMEYLVARCEAIPDAVLRSEVLELFQMTLAVHRQGLARLLEAAAGVPHLEAVVAAWRRDPQVRGLAELHGLELPRPAAAAAGGGNFVPLAALGTVR